MAALHIVEHTATQLCRALDGLICKSFGQKTHRSVSHTDIPFYWIAELLGCWAFFHRGRHPVCMLKRDGVEVLRDDDCELSLQGLEHGIHMTTHSERQQWLADIEAGKFRLRLLSQWSIIYWISNAIHKYKFVCQTGTTVPERDSCNFQIHEAQQFFLNRRNYSYYIQ